MSSSSPPDPELMLDPVQHLPLLRLSSRASVFHPFEPLDEPTKKSLINATVHFMLAHSSSKELFTLNDLKNHLCVTHAHLKDDVGKYKIALLCESQEVLRNIFGLDIVNSDQPSSATSISTSHLVSPMPTSSTANYFIVNLMKHDLLTSSQSDYVCEEIAVVFVLLQVIYCSRSSSSSSDTAVQATHHIVEVARLQELLEPFKPLPDWLMNGNRIDGAALTAKLEKWRRAGYFVIKDGLIGIGIRSVVEYGFRRFIRSHFMENDEPADASIKRKKKRLESAYVIDMIENREQKESDDVVVVV